MAQGSARALRSQMVLPGMPQYCPYCGSGRVSPAGTGRSEAEDIPGLNWECRSCERVWGQLPPDRCEI